MAFWSPILAFLLLFNLNDDRMRTHMFIWNDEEIMVNGNLEIQYQKLDRWWSIYHLQKVIYLFELQATNQF